MLLSNLFLLLNFAFAATDSSLLEAGSHCVAYRAEKVMMLVSTGMVVGKNCDISAQVLPEVGGLYHIEVNVPIRSFSSGDVDRDETVMKALKADVRPELTFRTKGRNVDAWRSLFAKGDFDLDGELLIGDKVFPLKVVSHYVEKPDGAEVDGIAKVRYADFEIPPPRVGGGLIAKAKPEFELHFHLLSSRILGADSIRLAAAVPATALPEKPEAQTKTPSDESQSKDQNEKDEK